MVLKLLILLFSVFLCCESVVYSRFYAPLFDRRILNYRVDAKFEPDAGQAAREPFEKRYGYRGQRLIADLGNGKDPSVTSNSVDVDKIYGDVKFYYT